MVISRKLIEKLPKTDLHCHLDGSMRPETLIELAQKNSVRLPSYDVPSLMSAYKFGGVRLSLEEYIAGFEPLVQAMASKEDVARVAYELCEDAFLENVWHLEVRYCPNHHDMKTLAPEEFIEAAIEGTQQAQKKFGISVGHILCGLKHHDSKKILDVAKLAAQYANDGVVGFDLAGPEAGFPIRDHLEAIYYARRHHLFITIHAGESYGPESIAMAIYDGHAHRIGHGTSLPGDPDLLDYIVNHRIGIEACPISNWHTGAIKSLDNHPLPLFLKAGVRVSLNTDNRLVSDTSVTEEILAMIEHFDLSIDDVKKILVNGFKSAFLPHATKTAMLNRFHIEWENVLTLHSGSQKPAYS